MLVVLSTESTIAAAIAAVNDLISVREGKKELTLKMPMSRRRIWFRRSSGIPGSRFIPNSELTAFAWFFNALRSKSKEDLIDSRQHDMCNLYSNSVQIANKTWVDFKNGKCLFQREKWKRVPKQAGIPSLLSSLEPLLVR